MAAKLINATRTHEVLVWTIGLDSAERHLERIALRVRHGGHSIPEHKVRERYTASMANLVRLVPHVHAIQVFDNSATVTEGQPLHAPRLVALIVEGRLAKPGLDALHAVPRWAVAVVEAALG